MFAFLISFAAALEASEKYKLAMLDGIERSAFFGKPPVKNNVQIGLFVRLHELLVTNSMEKSTNEKEDESRDESRVDDFVLEVLRLLEFHSYPRMLEYDILETINFFLFF